jgi:WD40 repeat protein
MFRQSSHLLTSLPPTGIAATLAARLSPPLTLAGAGAPDQPLPPWTVTWTRPDRHLEPVWPMPDLPTPALERVLDLGSWLNASLSWPPADGDLLAIATETDAQIWSAQSGERLIVLRFGDGDDGPTEPVHRAVWNVQGELAIELVGGDDGPSRLHLIRNVPWLLRGESGPDDANVVVEHDSPSTVKWSSDGARYSLSGDGVQVRDAHTQEVLVTYAGMNAEWSPHDLLAVCDGAGLAVYAPPAAEPLLEIRHGADRADIPKWSSDGKVLSALCGDGAIRRWDARTGTASAVIDPPVGDDFTCLCVGPHGELAAGTGLGFLVVHAADDAALIAKVRVHEQGCSDVEWSPSGRYLATAGVDDYRVSVWDPAKLGVDESAGQRTSSYSVGWSPQGDRLLTTHADGVRLWDRDANVLALFPDDRDMTNGGAWSPDGTVCVIGSASGHLTLADAQGLVLDSWSASGDPAFAWSASGHLAYAVDDGDARSLRVRAQDGAVADVPARLGQLRLASWSPDGSRLAVVHGPETFGPDTPGRLSVVTVATGEHVDLRSLEREPVQLLWPGHSGPVLICDDSVTGWSPTLHDDEVEEIAAERPVIRCAAWTPDGHRLVVGTIDGQLLNCTGWPGGDADSSQVSLEVGLLALSVTPEADRIAATTSLSTLSVFSTADDPMTIAVDGTTWACGWSPDGEVIAVAASSGVYLFRLTAVEADESGRRADIRHDGR